jgi:hypothetical protein
MRYRRVVEGVLRFVICEVLAAVAMKNADLRDTRTQFVPDSRYITSPLQSPAG